MNRLPQKKKRGDPVLAEDWNTLIDAIASRTPRPGTGLELIASSGGFAYSTPTGQLALRSALPPFAVIGIEKGDEDNYDVILKEGWVIERKPKSMGDAPSVEFHMPKVGEEMLNAVPKPKLSMSLGDTAWCKFTTTMDGELNGSPEIIASADDKNGTHYQPQDPDEAGTEGEYYVKIFKLEDDEGSPKVTVYQQSDIEHWAQLWRGDNAGGGARIFKHHKEDENVYKFRTVRGDFGIIETETADEVELDFWGENVGESGAPVYKVPQENGEPNPDPPDGPAQFRVIGPRESQPQIQVKCEAPEGSTELPDKITVRGNDMDGDLVIEGDNSSQTYLLSWRDGLVTTDGLITLKVKEYMVCDYGQPKTVKFVILEETSSSGS